MFGYPEKDMTSTKSNSLHLNNENCMETRALEPTTTTTEKKN